MKMHKHQEIYPKVFMTSENPVMTYQHKLHLHL